MPELPEVETTLRGIAPHVEGRRVDRLVVRQPRLRRPVPDAVHGAAGRRIGALRRRAKYLVMPLDGGGGLLWHLGMSGSMRVLTGSAPAGVHDHVDLQLAGGPVLRFTDPRRFGLLLWFDREAEDHPLLARLGPEPLAAPDLGEHLWRQGRGRRTAVKNLVMDGRVVVGVGNIYASEALHRAGINPVRAAGRISRARYRRLGEDIRSVLSDAITEGGTSLRDFTGGDGQPGYFAHNLRVYDRAGQPCRSCGTLIRRRVIGQRATYHCPRCQT